MSTIPRLVTERLILRGWEDRDRAPFAELNADTEVMAHFVKPLSRAETDAMIDRSLEKWRTVPPCWFAVETHDRAFVGMVGLNRPAVAGLPPQVEIGWRLARRCWGRGFATEGARASLAYGFDDLGLDEIISFAVPANTRSTAVMERIGMRRDASMDFDHPNVPEGHPSRRHIVYRLMREDWTR